jgi:hypothetical protein
VSFFSKFFNVLDKIEVIECFDSTTIKNIVAYELRCIHFLDLILKVHRYR